MDLSICIVNWNTCEMLRECLRGIENAAPDLELEVIVVDNASTDGSAAMVREEFDEVTLIENDLNVYYAAGNNQALDAAQAPLKLLLNPDIEVHSGGLRKLVNWMDRHPEAGAVAPKLIYPDGTVQYSCRTFPDPDTVIYEVLGLSRLFSNSKTFGKWRMTWWDYDDERRVDQPMASALCLRSEALREVGHFDEQFPMFFNDVDLCKRLWDAGWEIWFTPSVTMTHHHGAATRQVPRRMIIESGRSFVDYYRKHYRGRIFSPLYYFTVGLLRIAYAVRSTAALLKRQ